MNSDGWRERPELGEGAHEHQGHCLIWHYTGDRLRGDGWYRTEFELSSDVAVPCVEGQGPFPTLAEAKNACGG